jgi:hypothetical protein
MSIAWREVIQEDVRMIHELGLIHHRLQRLCIIAAYANAVPGGSMRS